METRYSVFKSASIFSVCCLCSFLSIAMFMRGLYLGAMQIPSIFKTNVLGMSLFLLGAFSANSIAAQNSETPVSGWGSSPGVSAGKKVAEPGTGFPIFQDNGNPDADIADYQKRKADWIKDHPEAYQKMIGQPTASVHLIPKAEFDQFPQEKKDHILQNPSLYRITENKLDDQ